MNRGGLVRCGYPDDQLDRSGDGGWGMGFLCKCVNFGKSSNCDFGMWPFPMPCFFGGAPPYQTDIMSFCVRGTNAGHDVLLSDYFVPLS